MEEAEVDWEQNHGHKRGLQIEIVTCSSCSTRFSSVQANNKFAFALKPCVTDATVVFDFTSCHQHLPAPPHCLAADCHRLHLKLSAEPVLAWGLVHFWTLWMTLVGEFAVCACICSNRVLVLHCSMCYPTLLFWAGVVICCTVLHLFIYLFFFLRSTLGGSSSFCFLCSA